MGICDSHDDVDEGGDIEHIDFAVFIHIGTRIDAVVHDYIDESSDVEHIHFTIAIHIATQIHGEIASYRIGHRAICFIGVISYGSHEFCVAKEHAKRGGEDRTHRRHWGR